MKYLTTKHAKNEYEIIRKNKRNITQFYKLLFFVFFRESFVNSVVKKIVLTSIVFTLLQQNLSKEEISERILEKDSGDEKYKGIRCPHCKWQPNASSGWCCSDCDAPEHFYNSCGTVWNTFDTEGICPGCSHRWLWTSCLNCSEWALHKDWYVEESQK